MTPFSHAAAAKFVVRALLVIGVVSGTTLSYACTESTQLDNWGRVIQKVSCTGSGEIMFRYIYSPQNGVKQSVTISMMWGDRSVDMRTFHYSPAGDQIVSVTEFVYDQNDRLSHKDVYRILWWGPQPAVDLGPIYAISVKQSVSLYVAMESGPAISRIFNYNSDGTRIESVSEFWYDQEDRLSHEILYIVPIWAAQPTVSLEAIPAIYTVQSVTLYVGPKDNPWVSKIFHYEGGRIGLISQFWYENDQLTHKIVYRVPNGPQQPPLGHEPIPAYYPRQSITLYAMIGDKPVAARTFQYNASGDRVDSVTVIAQNPGDWLVRETVYLIEPADQQPALNLGPISPAYARQSETFYVMNGEKRTALRTFHYNAAGDRIDSVTEFSYLEDDRLERKVVYRIPDGHPQPIVDLGVIPATYAKQSVTLYNAFSDKSAISRIFHYNAMGNRIDSVSEFWYDQNDQPSKEVIYRIQEGDPQPAVNLDSSLSALYRKESVKLYRGMTDEPVISRIFHYDGTGEWIDSITEFWYDQDDRLSREVVYSVPVGHPQPIVTVGDALATYPRQSMTLFVWNGEESKPMRTFHYNALGDQIDSITEFWYDQNDQLKKKVIYHVPDGAPQPALKIEWIPASYPKQAEQMFNASGQIVKQVLFTDNTKTDTLYQYDSNGMKKSELSVHQDYTDGSQWYLEGTAYNGAGQITTVSKFTKNSKTETSYQYDSIGNKKASLTSHQNYADNAESYFEGAAYNEAGKVTIAARYMKNGRKVISYLYHANGERRLVRTEYKDYTDPSKSYVQEIAYDESGNVIDDLTIPFGPKKVVAPVDYKPVAQNSDLDLAAEKNAITSVNDKAANSEKVTYSAQMSSTVEFKPSVAK